MSMTFAIFLNFLPCVFRGIVNIILNCGIVVRKLATIVEGDPKASFSIATTPMCWEDLTPSLELLHLTLDTYLIMLRRYQVPFFKSLV